jgi:hypothetical protein
MDRFYPYAVGDQQSDTLPHSGHSECLTRLRTNCHKRIVSLLWADVQGDTDD